MDIRIQTPHGNAGSLLKRWKLVARSMHRAVSNADKPYMSDQQQKDPLHGVTLEMILTQLVERQGWEKMGQIINIRCFNNDPSIKSSLQFLRKTPWARAKVEELYLKMCRGKHSPNHDR